MRPPRNNPEREPSRGGLRPRVGVSLLVLAALTHFSTFHVAAQTTATNPPPAKMEGDGAADAVRSFLQLQEQVHAAQLAIERNRREAEAAATRNVEAIAARLHELETSLVAQRTRELEAMQDSNRLLLTVGGTCAALGFLAMLLTAFFQWRAVNRLTEFSVVSQASFGVNRGALPAPGTAEAHPISSVVADQAQTQLFGAVERMEKRILELEHTTQSPVAGKDSNSHATAGPSSQVAALLVRAESLLRADQAGEALACYDEILALEPNQAEALVRRGDALERLHKFDDAIVSYDRAIAADGSLTIAYLHKGALFNRLERFEQALQCYEQALQTQERSRPG